jgi:hypothetical protein
MDPATDHPLVYGGTTPVNRRNWVRLNSGFCSLVSDSLEELLVVGSTGSTTPSMQVREYVERDEAHVTLDVFWMTWINHPRICLPQMCPHHCVRTRAVACDEKLRLVAGKSDAKGHATLQTRKSLEGWKNEQNEGLEGHLWAHAVARLRLRSL